MEGPRRKTEPVTERTEPVTEMPMTERRVSMELSWMAERRALAERESMAEKVEVEREVRMDKAEEEAERMMARRQKPWRRVEIDEVRMEAEAEAKRAKVKLERDMDDQVRAAELVVLEMEREMDEQRRVAEVAELERLLAELESDKAEAEARNKRREEALRIFRVWWQAWEEDGDEEEDREWVKTWAATARMMYSVRTPSPAVMALWKAWEHEEDLFIELYDRICGQKMDELLSNKYRRKKKVEALKQSGKKVLQQELENDEELMMYCRKYMDFQDRWEDKYSYMHGQFEDITKKSCMQHSYGPLPSLVFNGPRPRTLQIFSVKIIGGRNHEGSNWPLQVYGLISVRDFIDPQRIAIFNRFRDDECQIVTEEDPYLPLTGPTRSIVLNMNESMGPVTIEAELKVKGTVESEDKYIILDAISLPTLVGSKSFELVGPNMKLEILLGAIQKSVEATVFIRVTDGAWPVDFYGQFVAKTASIEYNEIILAEIGDNKINQTRYAVSVEASGVLIITLKPWRGEEVGSVIFNAANRGRSFGTIYLYSFKVEVIVVWSLVSPYC